MVFVPVRRIVVAVVVACICLAGTTNASVSVSVGCSSNDGGGGDDGGENNCSSLSSSSSPPISFDSLPARFGTPFVDEETYDANLYLPPDVDDDPYFCEGFDCDDVPTVSHRRRRILLRRILSEEGSTAIDVNVPVDGERDGGGGSGDVLPDEGHYNDSFKSFDDAHLNQSAGGGDLGGGTTTATTMTTTLEASSTTSPRNDNTNPPPPIPIALLVKRGHCSFESKARSAMALNEKLLIAAQAKANDDINSGNGTATGATTTAALLPLVQFLVVYNNETYANESRLVPMGPECTVNDTANGVDVGLLFVNYTAGQDLIGMMEDRANETGVEPQVGMNLNKSDDCSSSSDWYFPVVLDASRPRKPEGGGRDDDTMRAPWDNNDNNKATENRCLPWFWVVSQVLICMLAIYLTFNAVLVWYQLGGRIYLERREGRRLPSMRYVHARGIWPRKRKLFLLTERQVLDLPEVEYSPDMMRRMEFRRTPCPDGTGALLQEGRMVRPQGETPFDNDGVDNHDGSGSGGNNKGGRELWCSQHTCSICLDDFSPREKVRVLVPCSHVFHTDCIMPWLTQKKGNCPLCQHFVWRKRQRTGTRDEFTSGDGGQQQGVDDGGGGTTYSATINVTEEFVPEDSFEDDSVGDSEERTEAVVSRPLPHMPPTM